MLSFKRMKNITIHWNVTLGLQTMLGALICSHVAYFFYPHDLCLLVLCACHGLFFPFYRAGPDRLTQVLMLGLYALFTYSLLILLALMLSFIAPDSWYRIVAYMPLIFSSLILPRYFSGANKANLFPIIYMLIVLSMKYSMNYQTQPDYFAITMSFVMAYPVMCLLILVLPFSSVPNLTRDSSLCLIKHALRVLLVLSMIFIFAYMHPVANIAWVAASALVVSELDIGSSVKKSLERVLGTVIGAVLGVILAHYLFVAHPIWLYLCLPLIFASYALMAWSYGIGIALVTVWLSASFYFLSPSISLEHFMTARVLDTFLGVIFGLFGVFFIFPNSLYGSIKNDYKKMMPLLASYFLELSKESARDDVVIKQLITQIRSSLIELISHQRASRYEPALHWSKRYYHMRYLANTFLALVQETEALAALPEHRISSSARSVFSRYAQAFTEPFVEPARTVELPSSSALLGDDPAYRLMVLSSQVVRQLRRL